MTQMAENQLDRNQAAYEAIQKEMEGKYMGPCCFDARRRGRGGL